MKILDFYIIKKFLITLSYITVIISIIVLIIDINEKLAYNSDKGFNVFYALLKYYPYFIISILSTFSGILIFISTLFFTSKLADNLEIISIINSGISFYRFSRSYIYVIIIIIIISFFLNHFILPVINKKKNIFEYSLKKSNNIVYKKSNMIAAKISNYQYLFINNYIKKYKIGQGFHFQEFDSLNYMKYELIASHLKWNDIDSLYILYDYFERKINYQQDILKHGFKIKKKIALTPNELLPEEYIASTMNSNELIKFINLQILRGSSDIYKYQIELYQRTSIPFSILILTLLALSISSKKRKEGIGFNLVIGLFLAFIYIFSFEIFRRLGFSGDLNPLLVVSLPNIMFGIITLLFYLKRFSI